MIVKNIETVAGISDADFKKKYLHLQKPVVIKGLAFKYPAGKKWTIEYIKKICGSVSVDVYNNAINNNASAYTRPDLKMQFNDYVEFIVKNEPSPFRIFLFNMFKSKPELRKDFPCPEVFRGILGRMGFMFFGARGVTVRIHQDMDMSNVLLTQFYGQKKVVLISPEYSDLLYRLPFNTHSLINLDQPDPIKYPGLEYLEIQECILEPGDALFMPSGYWHYITYLDAGFSVSYRKMAIGVRPRVQGILNVFVYMPFDKLMNYLLPKKWLLKKEKIAEQRGNKAIRKIKPRVNREKEMADVESQQIIS